MGTVIGFVQPLIELDGNKQPKVFYARENGLISRQDLSGEVDTITYHEEGNITSQTDA